MDSQNYCNTFADLQTENTDQLYPIGSNTADGMPDNVEDDFGSDPQLKEL